MSSLNVLKSLMAKVKIDDVKRPTVAKATKAQGRINFTHSIYATVIAGPYKGYDVEVREFYPVKYEVELEAQRTVYYKKDLQIGEKIQNCEIVSKPKKNKYIVKCKKTVLFSKNNVSIEGTVVTIKRGEFKGMKGKLIKIKSPRVKIYIDTGARKVDEIISVSSLFYKDLLLKNGNHFSVKSVTSGPSSAYTFVGIERIDKDNKKEFVKTSVTSADVSETFISFKTDDTDDVIEFSPVYVPGDNDDYELESPVYVPGDNDELEYAPDAEAEDEEGDEEEDEGERGDEEEDKRDAEGHREYKIAYTAMERVAFEKSLNIDKQRYNKMIHNILKYIRENEDNIDLINVIESVDAVIKKFDKLLKDAKINFNIKESTDLKLIVAVIVLLDLAKKGMHVTVDDYISSLTKNDYFFKKVSDISSVLLTKDTQFECKLNAVDDKSSKKIITTLMNCYNDHIQKILGTNIKFETSPKASISDLKPIVAKGEEQRKFITVKDIVFDTIPENATRVMWGDKYKQIVDETKKNIKEKIDKIVSGGTELSALQKKKKGVYEYIYENFDEFPVILKNLKERMLKMLKETDEMICTDNECMYNVLKKYTKDPQVDLFIKMSMIVDKLKKELKKMYEKLEKTKTKKIEKLEKSRLIVEKKREKISLKRKVEEAGEEISKMKLKRG